MLSLDRTISSKTIKQSEPIPQRNILNENRNQVTPNHFGNIRRDTSNYREIVKELTPEQKELVNAVLTNNLEKVETILKGGLNPNIKDESGNTLLHNALRQQNKEMMSLLIKYEASPDIKNNFGDSVVHDVVRTKDLEMAKLVITASKNIDQKNEVGSTPLHISVSSENKGMADLLLEHKANPNLKDQNGNAPLHTAIMKRNQNIGITLVKAGADSNQLNANKELPTIQVIGTGMNNLLEEMLKNGADANKTHEINKNPPLYFAITKGDEESSKLLVKYNANINFELQTGNSLLMYSIEINSPKIFDIMLSAGASLDKINKYGENALSIASKNGNNQIIEKILDKGGDINFQNAVNGKTPLHLSVRNGYVDTVELLTSKGAKLEIKDKQGNTPLFEVVSKPLGWWIPRPRPPQSDIAHNLLKKGASISQYETNNTFISRLADVININHPGEARHFLFSRVNNEWDKFDARRVNAILDQYASKPNIDEKEIDKLLLKLLHPDINYKDDKEATRHAAHLRSWDGVVKRDGRATVDSEGWWMHIYPPLKTKSLIMSLNKINHSNFDCMKVFGEPKERVMKKIKNEITSQMSTYYSQRHHDMMNNITDSKLKEEFKTNEASKYCKEIVKTPKGQEFAIASGFPGHAIYFGFRKNDENNVSRIVYNLGSGLNKHHSDSKGLVYPHIVSGLKMDHFVNESKEAMDYLKGVINAKLGAYGDPLLAVYDKINVLGGKQVLNNIPGIPQKRQLVGNCVLKNNNASARNRMNNDRLFKFLKKEEQAFADEMSLINKKIIEQKEKEKDLLSFNFVVRMYSRNGELDSAVANLNTYFEKRSKGNLSEANNLRDVERIAFYIQNSEEKFVDELMKQPGALKMINEMAERRYCDTLKQIANRYHSTIPRK